MPFHSAKSTPVVSEESTRISPFTSWPRSSGSRCVPMREEWAYVDSSSTCKCGTMSAWVRPRKTGWSSGSSIFTNTSIPRRESRKVTIWSRPIPDTVVGWRRNPSRLMNTQKGLTGVPSPRRKRLAESIQQWYASEKPNMTIAKKMEVCQIKSENQAIYHYITIFIPILFSQHLNPSSSKNVLNTPKFIFINFI